MTTRPPATTRSRWLFQESGLLLIVIALGLYLTLFSEPIALPSGETVNAFFRLDNLLGNVAVPLSWIAIMAVGVTLVIVAGGIDISVGSIFAISALACVAVLQYFPEGASAWLVLPVAIAVPLAVGLACGLFNGLLVTALRVHPFIVTLVTMGIFRWCGLRGVPTKSLPTMDRSVPEAFTTRFIQATWTLQSGGDPSSGFESSGGAIALLQPVPVVVMLVCVAVAWVLLSRTTWGRQVYAVGGNEIAARYSGISVNRIKLSVYAASGLCAGLAGMVSAGFFGSASTATGEGYELMVVAAAVVGGASLAGGRGTVLGALLGALIIRLIENGIDILRVIHLGVVDLPLSKEDSKLIVGSAILVAAAADQFSQRWRGRRELRSRPLG